MDIAGEICTTRTPISRLSEYDNRNLVKRPQTASPYVMAVKYRNKAKISTRKANRAVITRRRTGRRRESLIDSEYWCESLQTNTSLTDLFDEFHDDYDYDDSDTDSVCRYSTLKRETRQKPKDFDESFVTTPLDSCSPFGLSSRSSTRKSMHEESERKANQDQVSYCENQYKRMCKMLNIIPVSSFLREMSTKRVSVRHRSLCPAGAKAIAVALLENPTVQILDMSDNEIGPIGASYLSEMLSDNRIITDLNLSDNKLGIDGAKHIISIAVDVDNFHSLNLSGNHLREFDAIHLMKLFEETHNLQRLILSHNEFREFGGKVIGDALKINDTIEDLDLSWNHLRFSGADGIAEGLALNHGLKKLDISWNGFSLRGCESLSTALQINDNLLELNLECNRINKDALEKLLKGLRSNSTLQVLKLAWNPISTKGAQMILDFINDTPTSGITKVDIHTQLVEMAFENNAKKLKDDRDIIIKHGMVRGKYGTGADDDDELSLIDENPIIVLMEFGHMNGFRLTDLFSVFDKDGSKSLDKAEIKTGLMKAGLLAIFLQQIVRMAGIPLQERCLEILIDKLDDDDSGEIEFGEMMQAQIIHKKQKAKMMKDVADGNIDIEKTEVGRVRGKLQRLMSKHMDGNPAFKRRVEEFKKLMSSSKREETLRAEFDKKMAMRRDTKIERSRTLEIRQAKEDALQEIIDADKHIDLDSNVTSVMGETMKLTLDQTKTEPTKGNNSQGNSKDWIALHV